MPLPWKYGEIVAEKDLLDLYLRIADPQGSEEVVEVLLVEATVVTRLMRIFVGSRSLSSIVVAHRQQEIEDDVETSWCWFGSHCPIHPR
jgi:hypothetical protein